jgi:threonylcarbamoyladenosine tRNA methylthiotransferase MtaB
MSKAMKIKPVQQKKKALVRVLGCKVNQAEAAAMANLLETHGYEIDPTATRPDVVVVNTCCVTQKAEGKSRRMVGRLAERFPNARLIVTGCLAEINPSSVGSVSTDTVLLSTFEKDRFNSFISRELQPSELSSVEKAASCRTFSDLGQYKNGERARNFLKIQDGCSQRCTYCIVPAARGPSRSLDPLKVLEHARYMEAAGCAEIVLTGVHLGCYGRDLSPVVALEDLVEQLVAACPLTRFRLSSLEPQEITPRLIELMTQHPGVCRHFHIPLQSGDDRILKKMGRPYDSELIRRLMDRIVSCSPEVCVGMDVMVGFPGEDEASFQRTVNLIRETTPAYLHVFPFSPRPGTPAVSFKPRVPEKTARQRVEELRELSAKLRRRFYERFLGATLKAVLEEAPSKRGAVLKARTDNYIPVSVNATPSLSHERSFPVRLESIADGQVFGTIIPTSAL